MLPARRRPCWAGCSALATPSQRWSRRSPASGILTPPRPLRKGSCAGTESHREPPNLRDLPLSTHHALAPRPQPAVFADREHTTLLLLHEAVQFVDNDLSCPAAHPAFAEWEKLAAEKEASRAAEEAQEVAKVYDKLDGMITKFVCGSTAQRQRPSLCALCALCARDRLLTMRRCAQEEVRRAARLEGGAQAAVGRRPESTEASQERPARARCRPSRCCGWRRRRDEPPFRPCASSRAQRRASSAR